MKPEDNSRILPQLRENLEVISALRKGGGLSYYLKNPDTGEVFTFGKEEFYLCRQLKGRASLNAIQQAFQERFGASLEIVQFEAFLRHLNTLGLLKGEEAAAGNWKRFPPKLSMLRLGDPDRFLAVLDWSFGWCFSTGFLSAATLLVVVAVGIILKDLLPFAAEGQEIFGPTVFFHKLAIGLCIVNVMGELAKAVAARRCGARVYESALLFSYRLIPLLHFDLIDACWFAEKREKLKIFGAGLICQVLLCAVGVIGWKVTHPWSAIHGFWFTFAVSALFFTFLNMFPLIKRDGFYLLSIWLEIPNFWERARCFVRSWIARKPLPEPLSRREIRWFKWFGSLSYCFGFIFWGFVFGVLGYLSIYGWKLNGPGALLFLVVIGLRFENIIKGHVMKIPVFSKLMANEAGTVRLRRLLQLGFVVLVVVVVFLPYPYEADGVFRLLPSKQLAIRSTISGEIVDVFVTENQWVDVGQPVATLLGKDQKAGFDQAAAALHSANEKLVLLKAGATPQEIARAEQEVKLAARSLEHSSSEAERATKEYQGKAISDKDYQRAISTRDVDRERLFLAQKNLEVVKTWPRKEEIRAQEAEVQRLQAEHSLAEQNLRYTTLFSPMSGRIITPYPDQRKGQYLQPGDIFALLEDSRLCFAEIEVSEEQIGEVKLGAEVRIRAWAYPTQTFYGTVTSIGPVAYEKSKGRIERLKSEKEEMLAVRENLRPEGKVIRVLSEFPNEGNVLKTDMTGYAKIRGSTMPLGLAFTMWAVRFIMVEIWSWIP